MDLWQICKSRKWAVGDDDWGLGIMANYAVFLADRNG